MPAAKKPDAKKSNKQKPKARAAAASAPKTPKKDEAQKLGIIESIGAELDMPSSEFNEDETSNLVEDPISTGILVLDLILGGGLSPWSMHVLVSQEGQGKTTIGYYIMAAALRQQILTFFLDAEASTAPDRMKRAGIRNVRREDGTNLFQWWRSVNSGERMFDLIQKYGLTLTDRSSGPAQLLAFVDSLTAMPPQRRVDKGMESANENSLAARMFSDGFQLIKSLMGRKRIAFLCTNQLREKQRVFGGQDPYYEACGNAVRFYSDIRIRLKKIISPFPWAKKSYVEREASVEIDGAFDRYNYTEMKTIKNKIFSPDRIGRIRIWFERAGKPGPGIDPVYDVYEYLRMTGQASMRNGEVVVKLADMDRPSRPIPWLKFKQYVLDEEKRKLDTHLWNVCWRQIHDKSAFRYYFAAEAGLSLEEAAAEQDASDREGADESSDE